MGRGEGDLAESDAGELNRDVSLSKIQQDFANRELKDLELAHKQRDSVFKVLLWLVVGSLVVVSIFAGSIGFGWLSFETPVAVAVIVGLTVHPLAVMGFLISALFGAPKKRRKQADE